LRAGDQLAAPPYNGELWIDVKTGDVLHFRSTAKDLPATFPVRDAEVVTDYQNVAFPDGTGFLLPVKSTVATRHRQEELTRNVVEFHGCHKFRATARMVDALPAHPTSGRAVEATTAELAAELDASKTIFAIVSEDAMAESAVQLQLEQQQDLRSATGEALWKVAQLEKQRQKVLAAALKNEKPSYEIVSSADGATTFKVNVRLVPVSVVVRDNKGRAVGGLKQEDFSLLDNRKPQEIINFSIEKAAGANGSKTPASAGDNRMAAANNVAYVFDDLHTAGPEMARAKTAAEKHLSRLEPKDRAAVFTTSGEVVLDFTADREKLTVALRRLRSHSSASPGDCPPLSYYAADAIVSQADENALQSAMEDALDCSSLDARDGFSSKPFGDIQQAATRERARRMVLATALEVSNVGRTESDRTLRLLHDVLARTAEMPGRRSILLVSSGFVAPTRDQQRGATYLIERALRAGVILNSLDVRGLSGGNMLGNSHHMNDPAEKHVLDSQEGSAQSSVMADFAYGTGGTFFHNNNDLEEGFRRTSDAPEFVYVLGFSPQKLDGKLHKLKVSLAGQGKLAVQARQGYYALKPTASQ
jgi:VWFA-related protein